VSVAGPGAFPERYKDRRLVVVHTVEDWHDWLVREGGSSDAVWLTVWKQAADPAFIRYEAVVEEALCHGWIDSTVNAYDELCFLQLLAPRKPGSVWSGPNKDRVRRMVAAGRMREQGRAAVDAAKADGSWTILDPVEAMIEPDALAAVLDADPALRSAWDAEAPSRRKAVFYRVALARTDATRAKRIHEAVTALREGGRLP
jgi:uncharacterized protein YdeI (YjbR/CyaY-like superfamily)